ncbi:MAG: hypothetical protein R3E67_02770 [Pseudomonadales bacterium]
MPVTSLHLISRYGGADPELAPWHRLGSEQWQKARQSCATNRRCRRKAVRNSRAARGAFTRSVCAARH